MAMSRLGSPIRRRRLDSEKFQAWSKVAKRSLRENIMAFGGRMPAVHSVEQFHAAQIGCREGGRASHLRVHVLRKFAAQFAHHYSQFFIHPYTTAKHIG